MQAILTGQPNNVPAGQTFYKAFVHTVVCFTHFTWLGNGMGTTSTRVFMHGIVFAMPAGQLCINIVLPVLLHMDGVLMEAAITATLIQVKYYENKGCTINDDLAVEDITFFLHEGACEQLYCTLLIELGDGLASLAPVIGRTKVSDVTPLTCKKGGQVHLGIHLWYNVYAYSCLSTVY